MVQKTLCANAACPNEAKAHGEKLKSCSICSRVAYCSKQCQKNSWVQEGHKYACEKPDVPRRSVREGSSLEEVQNAIDDAEPGDILVLDSGSYRWKSRSGGRALLISKPIRMWGPPVGEGANLHCDLTIDDTLSNEGSVTLANLAVLGSTKVRSNSYDGITFVKVKMEQSNSDEDGVMVHIMKGGTCLFYACELIGGNEALYIDGIDDLAISREPNENKVHIKRTIIRNGAKRGICADDKFILEKSIVKDNGWYGIRSNLGWTDKGGNHWQPNPAKPNQTPTSGNGMFDGVQIPIGNSSMNLNGVNIPISFSNAAGDARFPGFGQNARRM